MPPLTHVASAAPGASAIRFHEPLHATTGQNGLNQAKVFSEAVDVTGIVLTKLDGIAHGGIAVAIQKQLGVPVKLIGLGEGPDDLAPFDTESFVDALLED